MPDLANIQQDLPTIEPARCHNCNRTVRNTHNTCRSCEGCENCCECVFCSRCDAECSNDFCSDCNRCVHCCSCEPENDGECNVDYKNYPLTFHPSKTFTRNPSARYLSVEIEVCSVENPNRVNFVCDHYKSSIVSDGSLPDSGFEINPAPSSGDTFVRQIEEICKALNNAGATVNER